MKKKFEGEQGHKTPFTVPDGYFESFTDNVMSKIKVETKNGDINLSGNSDTIKERKLSIIRMMKPVLALVAMVGFAFLFVNIIFPLVVNDSDKIVRKGANEVIQETNTMTASVSDDEFEFDSDFNPTDDEIADYLSDNVQDFEGFYKDL